MSTGLLHIRSSIGDEVGVCNKKELGETRPVSRSAPRFTSSGGFLFRLLVDGFLVHVALILDIAIVLHLRRAVKFSGPASAFHRVMFQPCSCKSSGRFPPLLLKSDISSWHVVCPQHHTFGKDQVEYHRVACRSPGYYHCRVSLDCFSSDLKGYSASRLPGRQRACVEGSPNAGCNECLGVAYRDHRGRRERVRTMADFLTVDDAALMCQDCAVVKASRTGLNWINGNRFCWNLALSQAYI